MVTDLVKLLAEEMKMYADSHGSWKQIDMARHIKTHVIVPAFAEVEAERDDALARLAKVRAEELADAFMGAWDPKHPTASEHAVDSMRRALRAVLDAPARWWDKPHTHGGTDCGGGDDCPMNGKVYDERTNAEREVDVLTARLVETRALVDEWESLVAASKEIRPYVAGDKVGRYCGKAGREVVVTVDPLNWQTPEKLAAYCETRGCSCSMKVSSLPVRYQIDRRDLEAGAVRLLNRLAADLDAPVRDESEPS